VDELTRLAHAARLGDERALAAFIGASYREVWRLCAALVDEEAAEDLAQETYLRAVRALRRFRGDASARTWLLSIARRSCIDELRSRARRRERDARFSLAQGEAPALSPDVAQEVGARDLLAHLAPERRAAFALTQLLRLSYEEAAIVCDCPPGTIRSRVARARADLVSLLGSSERPNAQIDRPASDGPSAY
jgi:RNA polymerase sigma-70 factor, ECF subfamily